MPRQIRAAAPKTDWKIESQGRAWGTTELSDRLKRIPSKVELFQGKLFFTQDERLLLLGMLLENVGADAAVRLGDPEVWRKAIAALDTDQ